jgi:hypothetical protein
VDLAVVPVEALGVGWRVVHGQKASCHCGISPDRSIASNTFGSAVGGSRYRGGP